MKGLAIFLTCLLTPLCVYAQSGASQTSAKKVISSYLKALKSLNHNQMEQYWAEEVIQRSPNGSERPLDRDYMRKVRDFEREMKTVWSYKIKHVSGGLVTVELAEKNEFYDLLGVGKRTETRNYFVRDGRIYRIETVTTRQEYGDFTSTYERFKVWLSKTPAGQDHRIMQEGRVIFDGASATLLRPWLKRWSAERPKPTTMAGSLTPNNSFNRSANRLAFHRQLVRTGVECAPG